MNMTANAYQSAELQEFEALLDDKEINDYGLPENPINTRLNTLNVPDSPQSVPKKFKKQISFSKSPKNNLEHGRVSNTQGTEDGKITFSHTLGALSSSRDHANNNFGPKKLAATTFSSPNLRKNGRFARVDISSALESRQNKTDIQPVLMINKQIDALPNLKGLNKDLQKASFNELLSLYSNSTSNKPTKVFSENSTVSIISPYMAKKTEDMEILSRDVRKSFIFASPRGTHRDNMQSKRKEEIVKDVQVTLEELVQAAQTNTSENFVQSLKYETQKLELNSWMEMILAYQLAKVEILSIDLIHFGVLNHIEIPIISSKFNLDIENALSRVITETYGSTDNEARHVLVYLHEKKGSKKLFLSKFFFMIKSNHPYPNGLKREKEIITYYLLILGMFEFKLKYEDKPVSEEKIDAVKRKAFNLIKHNDNSMSPQLCEWINSRIRSQLFIEKIYINQDIKGKTDVNFMFNISEYIISNHPRFLVSNMRPMETHKKTSSFTSTNNSQNNSFAFVRDTSKAIKRSGLSGKNEVHSKEHIFTLDKKSNSKKALGSPYNVEEDRRNAKSRMRMMSPPASSQSQLFSSLRSPMDSLGYPRNEKPSTSIVGNRTKRLGENLKIINREEFIGLNISKPNIVYDKLADFMQRSAVGFMSPQKNI